MQSFKPLRMIKCAKIESKECLKQCCTVHSIQSTRTLSMPIVLHRTCFMRISTETQRISIEIFSKSKFAELSIMLCFEFSTRKLQSNGKLPHNYNHTIQFHVIHNGLENTIHVEVVESFNSLINCFDWIS